jgi:hypothetical protein
MAETFPCLGAGVNTRRDDWLALAENTVATRVSGSRGFDHQHAAWSWLLSRQVALLRDRRASELPWAGFTR